MMEDYYGVSIRTYQDYECTEMMEDVLRDSEFDIVRDEDKILLEKFAPKLFNTAPYAAEIVRHMMKEIAASIREYRKGIGGFKFISKERARLKKAPDTEVDKSLKEHATAILELLGNPERGENDYFTEHYPFFKDLMNLAENPSDFKSMRIKDKPASKTKIKKCLQRLKLPNKTNTIQEFINAL